MNMLEETEVDVVAYRNFIMLYKKNMHKLFCFIEGDEDVHYYMLRIRELSEFEPQFLQCYGKGKVINIYNALSNRAEYNKARVAYFVDKDFDESIKSRYPNIYETPCYSIENFYTSTEAFKRILETVFKLTEIDINYDIMIGLYKILQNEFHDRVTLLNSWIYFQREKEREKQEEKRLNLDGIKYDNLYLVRIDGVTRKYTEQNLLEWSANAYEVDFARIDEIISSISEKRKQSFFRGKYEFDFLCKFLGRLVTEYNCCKKGKSIILTKVDGMKTIPFSVSDNSEEMLAKLSACADTPRCLATYIASLNSRYKEVG